MERISLLMIVTCLLFSNSCQRQDQSVIEPDFQEYVDRFVSEADLRNIKVDIGKLKVTYGDTLNYFCGAGMPNDVVIRSSCWENFNDNYKEILLFHELGHAVLGRMHDNSKLPNGDFTTIMNQGILYSCYSDLTIEKRKYYLDKLFIPSTPSPEWAYERKTAKIIFTDSINAVSTSWVYYLSTPGCTNKGNLSSSAFVSPGTSLSITSETPSESFSHWAYGFYPQDIKHSSKLVLKVKVKLDGVTNNGVCIAIKGLSNSKVTFFSTTQFEKKIAGTSDFVEYGVDVPYYVSATDYVFLYLILSTQSIGTAYFDDVTLTNFE